MKAGQIVIVDWRDALEASSEPNKLRPAIIVGSPRIFGTGLPFELVVPLTGEATLTISGASVLIPPTKENACTKPCYALAWNVQSVTHLRITETPSHITDAELACIRAEITSCLTDDHGVENRPAKLR